jgi:hypothetical protein
MVKSLGVSTGQLNAFLHLHLRPINLVVYQGPSAGEPARNPYLGAGFPLRCFQRLSFPDLATRPCPERDNRCTRGRYFLILSY